MLCQTGFRFSASSPPQMHNTSFFSFQGEPTFLRRLWLWFSTSSSVALNLDKEFYFSSLHVNLILLVKHDCPNVCSTLHNTLELCSRSLPATILSSHLTLQLELSMVVTLQGVGNLSLSLRETFWPSREQPSQGKQTSPLLSQALKMSWYTMPTKWARAQGQMLISSVNKRHWMYLFLSDINHHCASKLTS